jgi:hypothetical protein
MMGKALYALASMQFFPTCSLILALTLTGCSSAPLPLPPIQPAPGQIANLRVFVMNASDSAAQAAGETMVTGYTIQMRKAVQRSLTRAGVTVVVSPKDPTDLIAKVDTENPGLDKPGLASMTLTDSQGIVIEQISVMIVLDERVDIDERGPVAMIEMLARSSRIMAFAQGHRRGDCEKIDLPGRPVLEVPTGEN